MRLPYSTVVSVFVLAALIGLPASAQVGRNPRAAALYQQAVAAEKARKYELAAQKMHEAIAAEPRNDSFLGYASHVERLAGMHEKGLAHAIQAVRLNPRVGWYYASVVFNAHACRKFDIVKEYGAKILKLGPQAVGEVNYQSTKNILEQVEAENGRSYVLTWDLDVSKGNRTRDGVILLPMASDLPYQSVKYELEGGKVRSTKSIGDCKILYVHPTEKKIIYRITVAEISHRFRPDKDSGAPLPEDVEECLRLSASVSMDSKKLAAIARSLKAETPQQTAESIRRWLKTNIKYKFEKDTWRFKSLDELIDRKFAECGGFSALFIGLCRNAKIPCRQVWGVAKTETGFQDILPAGSFGSHSWVEIYLAGAGWVPLEPQDVGPLTLTPPRGRLAMFRFGIMHDTPVEIQEAVANMFAMSYAAKATCRMLGK